MGNAALAAAVPYPGQVIWISHKRQRSTEKKKLLPFQLQPSYIFSGVTFSSLWDKLVAEVLPVDYINNHGYLEPLTQMGPKRLQIL